AMEMAVADRLTSSDSVAVTLGRYREIAEKFAAPYSSMASLLEASTLASLYQSSPYVFDSRVLPLDSRDAEPLLWSGDQLRDAVASLCESALAARDVLSGCPIGDLAYILTSTADADRFGMSAFDFAVYRILDITAGCGIDRRQNSRLPFKAVGESTAVECGDSRYPLFAPDRLLDMLVASDSQRLPAAAGALCEARLRRLTYASTVGTYSATSESFATPAAMRLLADYPAGNEWRPYVVCRLYEMGQFGDDTLAKRAALYDFLKGEAASSADAKAKSYLNNVCSRMLTPSYRVESVGQWLPSKGGDVAFKLANMSRAYVLLVPVSSSFAESDNPRVSGISPSGKILVLAERSAVVDKPVEIIDTVSSGSLPAGYYALVISTTPDMSGIPSEVGRQAASLVNVSDLSMFASDAAPVDVEAGKSQRVGKYLYVVDATDNSPREGVKVRFVNTAYKSTGTTELLTDRNGCVTAPYDNFKATAVSRNSRFVWSTSKGYYYSSEPQRLTADLLTDLALYHPGDTLRSVAVLSALRDGRLAPKSDERIGISLYNVNGECVASDTVVSDRTGRAVVALRIPAEGLTGRFTLRAVSGSDQIGSTSVEVAEYKAPTFGVTLDEPDVEASVAGDDVVTFSGAVASYSGMPLSDSKVEIAISYHPWWRPWMINAPSASEYATSAVVGADGRFKVELELSADDYSIYSMGSFSVTATATSPAGETNSSAVRRFTLGEGRRIEPLATDKIEVKGDSVVIPVKVTDILSRPVSARVGYRFVPATGSASTVSQLTGECSTPALSLAASALPSGTYRLQLVLAEGCKNSKGKWIPDTLVTDVTVWRPTDKCPPAAMPLWVPMSDVYAAPGRESAEVTVGAGYPGERVYCEISRGNGIIERHWLSPDGKNVKVKVDVPAGEGNAEVRFFGMHDLEQAQSRVTVYPAEMLRKSQFEVVTFRDRLTPGNQESWKFRFVAGYPGDMKPQGDAAVIAVLSNAALDAITPFKWNYVPRRLTAVSRPGNISLPYMRNASAYGYLSRGNVKDLSFGALDLPDFNFWGYSAYQRRIMIRGRGVQYKMAATSGSIDGAVVTESMSSYASANMVMNDMAAPKMESAEESAMDVAEVESRATADE
ncbi:MAG: hypothetical protein K2I48_09720, partial [Muribaculaceae bacterium]|nr:hypothetical protein [Muribaculaceae bacterium]